MNNINFYIHHHLGLGDHFICNGLVRHIIDRDKPEKVSLVVKKSNLQNIQRMFRDREEVEFYPIEKDSDFVPQKGVPVLRVGFENCKNMKFDKSFYECVMVPFSERWDAWYIDRDLDKEREVQLHLKAEKDYIFVHDKSSTGNYKLNIRSDLRQIKPTKIPCESSVFDWIGIIENAKEIHAINSSFVHLIDSVKTNGKLYYHDIKPNTVGFSLRKNWEIVSYG